MDLHTQLLFSTKETSPRQGCAKSLSRAFLFGGEKK